SLAETVMIGYGQRKEKKAIVGADEMKRNLMKDTLMPDGGWMNYTHYIKTRISLDTAESSFNNTEIEFEFDINKQGKAKNIDILKSPSEQINQQLIDAIEKGPKWIDNSVNKKSKKKAKIKL
ncbi:hypothetical protein, partial [Enterococcus faecium]|uniref:hypothetical protein n=1 Tax=Enterococcus faecium TaxID=1352 RepID=UPI003AB06726